MTRVSRKPLAESLQRLASAGERIPASVAWLGRDALTGQERAYALRVEARARRWFAQRAAKKGGG